MSKLNVAVVSDSHDNTNNLGKAVNIANKQKCSHLFHLGDVVAPSTALTLKNFNGIVNAVFGNCDGDINGLERVVNAMGGQIEHPPWKFNLEGRSIILMHAPFSLEQTIDAQEADFIFYGHLHKVDVRKVGKTRVVNPGETGGWVRKPSFFIVDLFSGDCQKIEL
jgi:putative phosphoesterase